MKKTKKVDIKMEAKKNVSTMIQDMLREAGITYNTPDDEGYEDYNFSAGTVIAHLDTVDVQIKLVTPANKVGNRYEPVAADEVDG